MDSEFQMLHSSIFSSLGTQKSYYLEITHPEGVNFLEAWGKDHGGLDWEIIQSEAFEIKISKIHEEKLYADLD